MNGSARSRAVRTRAARCLATLALVGILAPGAARGQEPGTIDTAVGNGTFGPAGDGGPATSAQLQNPIGMAIAPNGDLYVADTFGHRIRHVARDTGVITTVAGTGQPGFSGDGSSALLAALDRPLDVALDAVGHLFIADSFNNRIRRVDQATGKITTVAGNGLATFAGDGKPATQASFHRPTSVALDGAGRIYIADSQNNRVRVVRSDGSVETVAGNGVNGFSGDGGPASDAALTYPGGVTVDRAGNLYFSDLHNERVRRVDAETGVITTVAGNGDQGFSGDGGSPTAASFNSPTGLGLDSSGDSLFVVDSANGRVRRIDLTNDVIVTIAGDGGVEGTIAGWTGTYGLLSPEQSGFLVGDGGPASEGSLTYPTDLALDSDDSVFIVDGYGHRIRQVLAPL